jgi:hypothetical protein
MPNSSLFPFPPPHPRFPGRRPLPDLQADGGCGVLLHLLTCLRCSHTTSHANGRASGGSSSNSHSATSRLCPWRRALLGCSHKALPPRHRRHRPLQDLPGRRRLACAWGWWSSDLKCCLHKHFWKPELSLYQEEINCGYIVALVYWLTCTFVSSRFSWS